MRHGLLTTLNRPLFGTTVIPADARVDAKNFPEDEFPVCCPRCDYLLRGLADERCPECGDPFDRGRLLVLQYAVRSTKGWRTPEQRLLLGLGVAALLLVVFKSVVATAVLSLVGPTVTNFELLNRVMNALAGVLLLAMIAACAWTYRRWRLKARQREAILQHLDLASPAKPADKLRS